MRKPRELQNEATYHVCAQINRQEMIFEPRYRDDIPMPNYQNMDMIKELFMIVIKDARKKYSFSLKTFCIMGNHIHLMIQPQNKDSLSSIMQWILSVFARRFNKIFNYKGHLWYDRFKSKIIESMLQFINTFKYISNNPVRARLVDHPLEYYYNGIYHIYNKNFSSVNPPDDDLLKITINYLKYFNKEKIDEEETFYC